MLTNKWPYQKYKKLKDAVKSKGLIASVSNYNSAYASLIGLLGFAAGSIIIFFPKIFKSGNTPIFHEISYHPHSLAKKLIDPKVTKYETLYQKQCQIVLEETNKKTLTFPNIESISKAVSTRDSLYKIYQAYSKFKRDKYAYNESDSISFRDLNKSLHFRITHKDILEWNEMNKGKHRRDSMKVSYSLYDPSFPPTDSLIASTYLSLKRPVKDSVFIDKYPAIGVWIFSMMCLTAFCFVSILKSFQLSKKLSDLTVKDKRIFQKQFFATAVIILLLLMSLLFLWTNSFFDSSIILDVYFSENLTSTVICISLIGYTAGAFCIAGFIHAAAMLSYIANTASKEKSDDELKEQFEGLLECFNTYFIFISTILSIMVFSLGAIYSAVNSLDFVKLVTSDWGYSPARYDFVYLYGLVHTAIMLIMYLPSKFQFDSFENSIKAKSSENEPNKTLDLFKIPIENMKNFLVVSSPLLASLINSLFSFLFGN